MQILVMIQWNYRKDCPNSAGTSTDIDQIMLMQHYIPPTNVTQIVAASCALLQSSLVTILKELAKAKQTNQKLKKTMQMTQPKLDVTPANNRFN